MTTPAILTFHTTRFSSQTVPPQKIRVVINLSNKSSNGYSLNGILRTGPVLQSDLTTQILKWRFFKYVFNLHITKMYRQILVHSDHTRFQRILFRDKEGKLCDYELDTVTFGVNCAPFLAIRVLPQLAQDVAPISFSKWHNF